MTVSIVETVQRGQAAASCDLENCPSAKGSTGAAGSVKVPVSSLHKGGTGTIAIRAARFGTEVVKRGQRSGWSHFEHCARIVCSALHCRPIKIPVGALYEVLGLWGGSIRTVEVHKRGKGECLR
jgi:hypothetical protein